MQELRHASEVACEVALGSFRYSFTTPGDEYVLWQSSVRVRDLDICELNAPLRELLDEVQELTV